MGFMLLVAVLTSVVVAATIGIFMLVTEPPHGFTSWSFLWFVSAIEVIAGLLTLNHFARARSEYKPSGAASIAVWYVFGLYAVVGLLMIAGYAIFANDDGRYDVKFAAAMIGLTVFATVLAAILTGWDLKFEKQERPVARQREQHRNLAAELQNASRSLAAAQTPPDQLPRIQAMNKRLDAAFAALTHSHGGGVGSHESGSDSAIVAADELQLRHAVDQLQQAVGQLNTTSPAPDLTQIERSIVTLESALIASRLA